MRHMQRFNLARTNRLIMMENFSEEILSFCIFPSVPVDRFVYKPSCTRIRMHHHDVHAIAIYKQIKCKKCKQEIEFNKVHICNDDYQSSELARKELLKDVLRLEKALKARDEEIKKLIKDKFRKEGYTYHIALELCEEIDKL